MADLHNWGRRGSVATGRQGIVLPVTGPATDGGAGQTAPTFALGVPATLFDARVMQYAVAGDGRFLAELEAAPPTSPPITIVLNWTTTLKP